MAHFYGTLNGTTQRTTRGHKTVPVTAEVKSWTHAAELLLQHKDGIDQFVVKFRRVGQCGADVLAVIDVSPEGVATICPRP